MKKTLALLMALALSLAVTGCTAKPAATTQPTTPPATTPPAAQTADDQLFIGLAMHNQTETWAVQFAQTFTETAEAAGCKVAVTDANSTAANQVSQIEDLVVQGIDVLVVLPADYTALGNALKTAKAAGVAVVNADSKVAEADQALVSCFVTADCYGGGYAGGEYLAKILPKDAVIGGLNYSQLSVIADRFVGLAQALKDKGREDVTIIEKDCTDLSAVASYTEDMLMANPEICGFFCLNDNTALTCYSACAQLNKKDCIVIGFDGSPAGKQSIAAGEMTGSMVYSPIDMAKSSFAAAQAIWSGKDYERETTVDMWLIDPDNIGTLDLENWT